MSGDVSRLFDETYIARRRLRRWVALAVAVLVVLRLAAEVAPVMSRPDLALLDLWQSLRGTRNPSPQVVDRRHRREEHRPLRPAGLAAQRVRSARRAARHGRRAA